MSAVPPPKLQLGEKPFASLKCFRISIARSKRADHSLGRFSGTASGRQRQCVTRKLGDLLSDLARSLLIHIHGPHELLLDLKRNFGEDCANWRIKADRQSIREGKEVKARIELVGRP